LTVICLPEHDLAIIKLHPQVKFLNWPLPKDTALLPHTPVASSEPNLVFI